jgi:hypothetical protein
MTKIAVLACASVIALGGCASTETVQLRPLAEREADLYPVSQTRDGITVAVDPLASPARTEQYFATDLRGAGILPVHVIVSNHSPHRLAIGPADVLLVREQVVIDPLPVETVIGTVKRQHKGASADRDIEQYVARTAFQPSDVAPGATVRGLLYFPVSAKDAPPPDRYWSVGHLLRVNDLSVRVGLTDADTKERVRFGPLPVVMR